MSGVRRPLIINMDDVFARIGLEPLITNVAYECEPGTVVNVETPSDAVRAPCLILILMFVPNFVTFGSCIISKSPVL